MPWLDRFRRRRSTRGSKSSNKHDYFKAGAQTKIPNDVIVKPLLSSPVSVLEVESLGATYEQSFQHILKNRLDDQNQLSRGVELSIPRQENLLLDEVQPFVTPNDSKNVHHDDDNRHSSHLHKDYSQSQSSTIVSLMEPPHFVVNSQASSARAVVESSQDLLEETLRSEATTILTESSEDCWKVAVSSSQDSLDRSNSSPAETETLVSPEPSPTDLSNQPPSPSQIQTLQDVTNHSSVSRMASPKMPVEDSMPSRDSSSNPKRKRILIEKGDNKGHTGTIVGLLDRRTYQIKMDKGSTIVNVRFTSCKNLQEESEKTEKEHDGDVPSAPSALVENDNKGCDRNCSIQKRTLSPRKEVEFPMVPHCSSELNHVVASQKKNLELAISNDVVFITKGSNQGKFGTILGWKNRTTYEVKLETSGNVVGVRITSIQQGGSPNTGILPEENRNIPSAGEPRPVVTPEKQAATRNPLPKPRSLRITHQEQGEAQASEPSEAGQSILSFPRDRQKSSTDGVAKKNSKRTPSASRGSAKNSKGNKQSVAPRRNKRCEETGKHVKIAKGNFSNSEGIIIGKYNAGIYNIQIEEDVVVRVQTTSVHFLDYVNSDTESLASNATRRSQRATRSSRRGVFQVLDSVKGALRAGKSRVIGIKMDDSEEDDSKEETTFIRHILGGRLLRVEQKLRGVRQNNFDSSFDFDGRNFELISSRIEEDKESGSQYGRAQKAILFYADTTRSADGKEVSVRDVLSKLGDFSVLNPRKIMARLELFHSPARLPVYESTSSQFSEIEETGHIGCGFICHNLLRKICETGKNNGISGPAAELVSAIQVRIFIPSKGIFKGMLQRKHIASGPPIQLPPSMQKVLKSTTSDDLERAAIIICKNGIHPSPGSANEFIGRKLDPNRNPPPEKSFKSKCTPFKDMVPRLWQSLGVTPIELKKYKRECTMPERRNHAWIVGVADPTGALPADTIFIPGLGAEHPERIFVTRSPCLKHNDGRIIKRLVSKPRDMTIYQWEELQALPFGSIVFSNPREGMMSMPERIANGDLDGDLYLICWDKILLSQMTKAEAMVDTPGKDDGVLKTGPGKENWLEDAQDLMVDAGLVNAMGRLAGSLYKLSEKTADDNPVLFKRHPDAIAFADGFNRALEFKKHGGRIYLPEHLHEKLHKTLRHYVTGQEVS